MGVHGLWTLLSPAAHTTDLNYLYQKRLAVDVSLWLHQFAAGIRPREAMIYAGDGNSSHSAISTADEHMGGFFEPSSSNFIAQLDREESEEMGLHRQYLIAMFHRLCKLVHHGVRPVFVFDGQTPLIKRETVQRRAREKRKGSKMLIQKAVKKFLRRQLQHLEDDAKKENKRKKAKEVENGRRTKDQNESGNVAFRLPRSHEQDSLVGHNAGVSSHGESSTGDVEFSDAIVVDDDVDDDDEMGGFFMDEEEEEGSNTVYDSKIEESTSTTLALERTVTGSVFSNMSSPRPHVNQLLQSVERARSRQEGRIDPDVLASLPHDIREQIIDDIRTAKSHRRYASTSSVEQLSQQAPSDFSSNQLKHFLANRKSKLSAEEVIISRYEPVLTSNRSSNSSEKENGDNSEDDNELVLNQSGQLASNPDMLYAIVQRRKFNEETEFANERPSIVDDDDDDSDEFVTVLNCDTLDEEEVEKEEEKHAHKSVVNASRDSAPANPIESEFKSVELTIDPTKLGITYNDDIFTKELFKSSTPERVPQRQQRQHQSNEHVFDIDNVNNVNGKTSDNVDTVLSDDDEWEVTVMPNDESKPISLSNVSIDNVSAYRQREAIQERHIQERTPFRSPVRKLAKGKEVIRTVEIDDDDDEEQDDAADAYKPAAVDNLSGKHMDHETTTITNDEANMIEFSEMEADMYETSTPQPMRKRAMTLNDKMQTPPRRGDDKDKLQASPSDILSQQRDSQRRQVEQYEEEMNEFLENEAPVLTDSRGTLFQRLIRDIKEMLILFGIPYVEAPYEADSQCGFLNMNGLVDGVITDDSDVFLFGASHIYKHVFSSKIPPEEYDMQQVLTSMGLDRPKLVALAMLLGSDYTDGVHNVGIVTAMQIVDVFRPEEMSSDDVENTIIILQGFADWVRDNSPPLKSQVSRLEQFKGKFHKQKQTYILPDGFPSSRIAEAYLKATNLDSSLEPFDWGSIDTTAIYTFAKRHMKWNKTEVDRYLNPVLEHIRHRAGQQRDLGEWVTRSKGVKVAVIRSKRIFGAVTSLTKSEEKKSQNDKQQTDTPNPKRQRQTKKQTKMQTKSANDKIMNE